MRLLTSHLKSSPDNQEQGTVYGCSLILSRVTGYKFDTDSSHAPDPPLSRVESLSLVRKLKGSMDHTMIHIALLVGICSRQTSDYCDQPVRPSRYERRNMNSVHFNLARSKRDDALFTCVSMLNCRDDSYQIVQHCSQFQVHVQSSERQWTQNCHSLAKPTAKGSFRAN